MKSYNLTLQPCCKEVTGVKTHFHRVFVMIYDIMQHCSIGIRYILKYGNCAHLWLEARNFILPLELMNMQGSQQLQTGR